MARLLWWVPVVLFLAATGGSSAPLKGAHAMFKVRVPAQARMDFEERFEGGRRACVIAVGDHKPVVNVGIAVYDQANQLVAEDQGGGDCVAAIWYPLREAKYKIVVNNSGLDYNDMYLVFK
jgi:hypothetical protein